MLIPVLVLVGSFVGAFWLPWYVTVPLGLFGFALVWDAIASRGYWPYSRYWPQTSRPFPSWARWASPSVSDDRRGPAIKS